MIQGFSPTRNDKNIYSPFTFLFTDWLLSYLFREGLLPPGDEEHVVKQDDEHLHGLSWVQQLEWPLHQDLSEEKLSLVFSW